MFAALCNLDFVICGSYIEQVWPHRRNQGGQRSHVPPKILENIVILCFERRFSKQNSVIPVKSNILAIKFFVPPQFLGLLRHCLASPAI